MNVLKYLQACKGTWVPVGVWLEISGIKGQWKTSCETSHWSRPLWLGNTSEKIFLGFVYIDSL